MKRKLNYTLFVCKKCNYTNYIQYKEALKYLNDLDDEHVRYQRLVCLYALKEYNQARQEGMKAKALAKLMKEMEIGMNCTESYSEEEAKKMLGL